MRTAILLFALFAVCSAAPQRFYNPYRRFGGGTFASGNVNRSPQISQVTAQVTSQNANNPNGISFNGGLALASSLGVSGLGSSVNVDNAQAIQQSINVPGPPGFNRFYRG